MKYSVEKKYPTNFFLKMEFLDKNLSIEQCANQSILL